MASPCRYDEILTKRTANRKSGEWDACFVEVDDTGKQKCNTPTGSPSPGSGTFVFQRQNSGGAGPLVFQRQNLRRRTKRGPIRISPWSLCGFLFSMATLGVFCWQWNAWPARESEKIPSFERLSMTGTGSCSNALSVDQVSFTLVTQVSADRLWMMEHQCQRWQTSNSSSSYQHPISIAVFTNDTATQVRQQLKDFGCDMSLVSVQTLTAKLYPADDYPVNKLRNQALQAAKTSHAVMVDIDFWISQDLATILQREEVTDLLASDSTATIVIPAFQLERQCYEWRECPEMNVPEMPLGLKSLTKQILDHKVSRFDPTNRGGHGSTRYNDWFKQNRQNGETLLEIDCFLSNRYEPYLVFRLCSELPPFQEAFTGYGKNKMTWVMHLRRMGYSFWQLGKGAFVIHYPHLDSLSRMAWNNAPPEGKKHSTKTEWLAYKRGRMDHLFVEFREWLRREVPDQTRTPFCHDKLDDDARLWYDRKTANATVGLVPTQK